MFRQLATSAIVIAGLVLPQATLAAPAKLDLKIINGSSYNAIETTVDRSKNHCVSGVKKGFGNKTIAPDGKRSRTITVSNSGGCAVETKKFYVTVRKSYNFGKGDMMCDVGTITGYKPTAGNWKSADVSFERYLNAVGDECVFQHGNCAGKGYTTSKFARGSEQFIRGNPAKANMTINFWKCSRQ